MAESERRFKGIFTPLIVPLDASGAIDEPQLRGYVDWLIAKGVHGLYPNGSTGEFTRFSPQERRRVIEIVADQCRRRVPILAGAAEANLRETLAACEHYAGLGVDAVAIVSPFYYRLGPESVYAYFEQIAHETPIDVTLYNIPMFASPIDVETVERLAGECERIVAIKDSSGDLPQMMRMIAAVRPGRPEFSFLTGWDPAIMPMLLMGCDGGTNAISGIVPELTRALYQLTVAGELEAARKAQYAILGLFDLLFGSADFPEGFRLGLRARGIEPGRGRQPLSATTLRDHAALFGRIEVKLRELGLGPDREGGRGDGLGATR